MEAANLFSSFECKTDHEIRYSRYCSLGAGLLLLAGIALILLGDALLATVGIVLIIASVIIFLVDTKDLIVKTDERRRK